MYLIYCLLGALIVGPWRCEPETLGTITWFPEANVTPAFDVLDVDGEAEADIEEAIGITVEVLDLETKNELYLLAVATGIKDPVDALLEGGSVNEDEALEGGSIAEDNALREDDVTNESS